MNKALLESDRYAPDASLSNPETCGEDVVANLRIAVQHAPQHCIECSRYHPSYALGRVARLSVGSELDRAEMIATVRRVVAEDLARFARPVEIRILGAADTGVLSTCAHAVSTLGSEAAARVKYTLLDLCETPLAMCRVYAARFGLDLQTRRADFNEALSSGAADLIVLHSILRHLPMERHPGLLKDIAASLTDNGRILVSNRLDDDRGSDRAGRALTNYRALLQQAQERGELEGIDVEEIIPVNPPGTLRKAEYRTEDEMFSMFANAGLRVESSTMIRKERQRHLGESSRPPSRRLLAVLMR